ncbi:MAG: D-cysteine desulfhydrase family protein [Proteobacteria bacterium]|nr:D-cysteine desulfhydrase family protein [Pseudomonadota bacterium]
MLTDKYPRAILSHTPTPFEFLKNMSKNLGGAQIWIKRDDCTGLAMGGNKSRQLEYYFGEAIANKADTILITGAVQSNYARCAVSAARKFGMAVEVQLEERTPNRPEQYYNSGNPYLMKLMGAKIHHYPDGEDEEGADAALYMLAEKLRKNGKNPYVIPLAGHHAPIGALGYVDCAEELLRQFDDQNVQIDGIIIGTGSGTTHAGLVAGLRALGSKIRVYGFCVRRDKDSQTNRVFEKTKIVAEMIERPNIITADDIWVDDKMLRPGYGLLNDDVLNAIHKTAEWEGILLDPVYTGKAMAGLIHLVKSGAFTGKQNIVFLHSGGTPAIFGYPEIIEHTA